MSVAGSVRAREGACEAFEPAGTSALYIGFRDAWKLSLGALGDLGGQSKHGGARTQTLGG